MENEGEKQINDLLSKLDKIEKLDDTQIDMSKSGFTFKQKIYVDSTKEEAIISFNADNIKKNRPIITTDRTQEEDINKAVNKVIDDIFRDIFD